MKERYFCEKNNFNKLGNVMQGENIVANAIVLEILNSGLKLPPLPGAGARLLEFTQQPMGKIDVASFAGIIETDPGLLSRVLQLANSPYYGSVNKIISLRKAITRIGLDETINSVCLYFFQKMIPEIPSVEGFSAKECWAHSWACAIANRRLGHPNLRMDVMPGELYIAGLLHGIGKLILAIHSPCEFARCIHKAKKFQLPLHEVEEEIFGTTDGLLAAKVIEMWGLPESICAAVGFYNCPQSAPEDYMKISALTQFAYCIAGISGVGNSWDGIPLDINSTWVSQRHELALNEEKARQEVIGEIITALEKKAESVTGLPPKKRAISSENLTSVCAGGTCKDSSLKKGFLARILGFFKAPAKY